MKKLLIVFVLLASVAFAQRDPWQNWEEQDNNGRGRGHDIPIVPEPSTYGVIFVAAAISFVYLRRKMKK